MYVNELIDELNELVKKNKNILNCKVVVDKRSLEDYDDCLHIAIGTFKENKFSESKTLNCKNDAILIM